jgi:hypothetical protein
MAALKIKLTSAEVEAIRQAITDTELTGDQYPEIHMKALYRDTPELSE